jgi:hypothetical protein
MLHLHGASIRRPQPPRMHDRELQLQADERLAHARDVALAVPSIDYLGWHGEHFVVVRHHHDSTISSSSSSSSVACGGMTSGGMGGVELREPPVRRRLDLWQRYRPRERRRDVGRAEGCTDRL